MQSVDGALQRVRLLDPSPRLRPMLLLDHVDEFQFHFGHVVPNEFGVQFVHDRPVPNCGSLNA